MVDKPFIRWSASNKVNLIKNLFSHHPKPTQTPSPLIAWTGNSGKVYQYEVFTFDSSFRALPGNYIYAMQTEDGGWVPIYIAQTRDLHQRLEGHVKPDDAIAHGATHMHAHYCSEGQASRCSEERDLLLRWHPICNEGMEH